jgi:hypothetical protein
VNALLRRILEAEAALMRRWTLPWGISMIGVFRAAGSSGGATPA